MGTQVNLIKEFNKAFGDLEQESPNIAVPQNLVSDLIFLPAFLTKS